MKHRAIVIGLLAVLAVGSPASAVEDVVIESAVEGFKPRGVEVELGEKVRWSNQDAVRHTSTSKAPLSLWHRSMKAGEQASRRFTQAGTFPYLCRIHPDMIGRVRVKMGFNGDIVEVPRETIVLRLATKAAPKGFRYRIQRRLAGGSWSTWRIVTTRSTSWKPTAAAFGEWEFRSLTERIANGARSGWSPVQGFRVVAA